jgi:hypothetical protein
VTADPISNCKTRRVLSFTVNALRNSTARVRLRGALLAAPLGEPRERARPVDGQTKAGRSGSARLCDRHALWLKDNAIGVRDLGDLQG